MTAPRMDLTPELKELQEEWLKIDDRKKRNCFYARKLAKPLARLFAELPLHNAPEELRRKRPRALISVLGLSWQPVALMAAWCRPERMLVLGTEKSLDAKVDGEGVLSVIAQVACLKPGVIERAQVGDPGEQEIYQHVDRLLNEVGAGQVFVDPTGGKKSMSAAAALAGFVAKAPLVYVDSHEENGGLPVPGTEYPRLLTNPLEVFAYLDRRDIFAAFDRGDFRQAAEQAERLAGRLYEPWEARCLASLARGYSAWEDFDFQRARRELAGARDVLDRFAGQGNWPWAQDVRAALNDNLPVLEELVQVRKEIEQAGRRTPERLEAAVPLLTWYLARARRLLTVGKLSEGVLMTYATAERYVRFCLRVDHGIDPEHPNRDAIARALDHDTFHRAGRTLHGEGYREPDLGAKVTLANGAQMLCAMRPTRLTIEDLTSLNQLIDMRNALEYEHAWIPKPVNRGKAQGCLARVEDIVARIAGGRDALERRLERYRLPRLQDREPAPDR